MSNPFESKIPKEVAHVANTLENKGFEAYLVGGCVRDLLLGKTPKDWDITTNADPDQIQETFEKTFYENEYGTVGVVNEDTTDETLKVVEVTPYRLEERYSDARHPDSVTFSKNIEDDLKRRDFTINAIAYSVSKGQIVDKYKGQEDIKDKKVQAVGDPDERFSEDALRILRAIRLTAELGFTINTPTEKAIEKAANHLEKIATERIRDELIRIIMSDRPKEGLEYAHKLGVLPYVVPDLERGIGIDQNQAHKYEVFEHNLRCVQHSADKKWDIDIRLAALFHDISKPETRRWSDEKKDWTFHGHDVVGARVTKKILNNLKFPKKTVEKVVALVRWHLFFSDPDQITLSAVRRMVKNVGRDNIWDLMNVRACDRIGTGRPKEHPYRFRKYKSMVEEALRDPTTVGMLNIKGNRIMEVTGETPGPNIGLILHALLEEVLEDPKHNTKDYLEKRAQELAKLSKKELEKLGESGKQKIEKSEEDSVKAIREKYWVK
jgi:putative nucleotidyltransferase with HDIG domain|tara:strand:- start:17912 stop:19390 length:1479 start_codon:yes stop_codon:yes gene_type:complete